MNSSIGPRRVRAVLFDMDGVLVDAREWHYEALNRALEPFGIPIPRDAHLSVFDGLPTRRKIEILSATRGLPRGIAPIINELKQRHTLAMVAERCHPVFQHRYMLSRLRREGYRTAMCSNSVRATVDAMARAADLAALLEFTLSNEDVARPKPEPDIYVEAMSRLGVAPDECLIVEDNENGAESARRAGGHLLRVSEPSDVTYDRVMAAIISAGNGGGGR